LRARRRSWTISGNLSGAVAFPAKTRARSRRSCVRTRRTFVLFVSIITPCRPSGLLTGHPAYRLALYNSYLIYNLYNDIPCKSREIAGSEAGAPGQGERVMHFEMFGASVLVGLMSGWLAGIAMKGGGYGLLWDIIFGLSGSFVGSWIFQTLGAPEAGWGGTGIAPFVGAGPMVKAPRKTWPPQGGPALERGSPGGGGGGRCPEERASAFIPRGGCRVGGRCV